MNPDDDIPRIAITRRLAAHVLRVLFAFSLGRNGQQELADRAVVRLKMGSESNESTDGNDVDVEPSQCACLVIVALGEHGLKPGEGLEFPEIDLIDLVERRADRMVDIEIATGKDGARVEELLEDRERPRVQFHQRPLQGSGRYLWEAGSQ